MNSEISDPVILHSEFKEEEFEETFNENIDPHPRKCVWQMNDDVVVSGISGRFPQSDNVKEFRDNLMNGVDMVTESDNRWKPGFMDLPLRKGTIKSVDKFDCEFFNVSHKQTEFIDIQIRMLLECTYEAIVDAGISPQSLSNTKTGVFIGNCSREKECLITEEAEKVSGYYLLGLCKVMFANRISYFFNFKGPSIAVDTACSSALSAFDAAVNALRSGECDRAIVGGAQLSLNPIYAAGFQNLGMLSKEGKCRVFDKNASGYARSEAIAVCLLEKLSDAKRVYATVIHCKTNVDGRKLQGITYPSLRMQATLISEVYKEANIDYNELAYLEAHGTGTQAGDGVEGKVITRTLIKNRKKPLLVGAVKSNMGHSEATSGLCGLIKVIIAMEEGIIPANLHYKEPNPNVPALHEGRLKVVTENTPWEGGLVGISGFGFGGVNVHVILRSNQINNDITPSKENLKLFAFSGRTSEAVETMLHHLQMNPNPNLYGLLSEMMDSPQNGHPYRGFTVLHSEMIVQEVQKCRNADRPVWFVFPGMGTQWAGMGRDLMELEVFRKSIMNCNEIMKPYGIDLYDLIMNGKDETFEQLLNNFVSIAAIQIALVDTLRILNLKPDGIVGHSVGEVGCAYADGCLTAEETILSAYWRGKCVVDSNLPPGAMAAVGLSVAEVNRTAPLGIVPACHNALDSVSISGEAETVKKYVQELKVKNIFVREVRSSGFAFHCHYMNGIGPSLLKKLREVIVNPKPRSSRWISSSVPEYKWDTELARTCSPEYLVNNLTSPVLFHEAMKYVPKNAILIEVAPHCILQAILKRSLGPEAIYLGLMKRNHPNNMEYFLTNIGIMYINGLNPTISKLYPSVKFPVPRKTPMISPYIRWDHSKTWPVPTPSEIARAGLGVKKVVDISTQTSEDYFLRDHKIDKRILFPASGYMFNAWRIFSLKKWDLTENLPVIMKKVELHRATILPSTGSISLYLNYSESNGTFAISEGGQVLASGTMEIYPKTEDENYIMDVKEFEHLPITSKDIYKELSLRGYHYGPNFQGIFSADLKGEKFLLKWDNNWITFIDTMLQCVVVSEGQRRLEIPTKFDIIKINPIKHNKIVETLKAGGNFKGIPMTFDKNLKVAVAGGVEIGRIQTKTISKLPDKNLPVTETYQFIPYLEERCHSDNPEFEKKLKAYNEICINKIVEISKKIKYQKGQNVIFKFKTDNFEIIKNMDQEKEEILNDNNFNTALLQVLECIASLPMDDDFLDSAASLLDKLSEEEDSLLNSLLTRRILKPCLDIVMENVNTKHIKVLELEGQNNWNSKNISSILNEYAEMMINVTYTIALNNKNFDKIRIPGVSYIEWQSKENSLIGEGVDLIIAMEGLSGHNNDIDAYLEYLKDIMKKRGFLLLVEPNERCIICPWINNVLGIHQNILSKDKIFEILEKHNLEIVCYKSDGFLKDLYLIKKASFKNFDLINIQEDNVDEWLNNVKNKLTTEGNRKGNTLWLISNNQPTSGIIGLVNCLRKEPGGDKIRCISSNISSDNLNAELKNLIKKDLVMNVFSDGKWGSFRHLPMKKVISKPVKYAAVNISTVGDLSSFKWLESPLKCYSFHSTDKVCDVYYSSFNFRDIMLATGRINDIGNGESFFGLECSGRDTEGKRLMGVCFGGGLSSRAILDSILHWNIPDSWTMEEAVTIPIVYSTVYYAFFVKGNLKPGKSVLIHSGAGGVGQAAISVALHLGCTVYTTVGTPEKREFLKQRFPVLKDNHISNSRDLSFEEHIMKETNGKGVDFVLNSLSGDKLHASINCLGMAGEFLEIGKYDFIIDSSLSMACFLKNISFHSVMLDVLEDSDAKRKVQRLVEAGIKNGAIQPLNGKVFDKYEIEKAARFMTTGNHIGKIVFKIREEETELITRSKSSTILAEPRFYANPDGCFIITGGLGGFGLELADWLIQRNAKQLVLSSRTGIKTGYQSRCIYTWRKKGINIRINTSDITIEDGVTSLIQESSSIAPVTGIFHLAMVLKDALLQNQTVQSFHEVLNPKVKGAKNLDKVSRQLCPNLEYFVVFSSVVSGKGNIGQSNYAFANSSMERICELRKKDNLPALAIQWGPVGDVGIVHETMGGSDVIISGTKPQSIDSCLKTLDEFLNQDQPVVSSLILADTASNKSSKDKHDILLIASAILGVKDPSVIDLDLTLGSLGIDSLMGVELQQVLERDFGLSFSMQEIRDLNIRKIKEINQNQNSEETDMRLSDELSNEYQNQHSAAKRNFKETIVASKCLTRLNNNEVGEPLFIVHGFEGNLKNLKTVISKLNVPVYGIQYTEDMDYNSLDDLVAFYVKEIQDVQPEGPYSLAGYTFGMFITLQIAAKLQKKQEKISHLILIHTNDPYVALIADKENGLKSDTDVQIEALCWFFSSIFEFHFKELQEILKKLHSFQERLETVMNMLRKKNIKNLDEISSAATILVNCLRLSSSSINKEEFQGDVLLLNVETEENRITGRQDLNKMIKGRIFPKTIDAGHETLTDEVTATKMANLIHDYINN